MRYVFGPEAPFAPLSAVVPAAPSGLADLVPTIAARDESGVTLDFAAYDAATTAPPVEAHAYWLPEGSPILATPELLMGAGLASTVLPVSVPAGGLTGLVLATPDAARPPAGSAPVNTMIRTVLGYAS